MKRLLIAIIALLPLAAVAQEGAYAKRVGEPKQLPGQVSSVVNFDGDIYVSVDGLLMRIHESDGEVAYVLPDTLPVPSERKAEYVTRHPKSGVVYFTKAKMFGKHVLYRIVQKENGKQVAEKVKPGGRSISIETPAFSPDGKFMVFVSKELRGFGGYDVYISEWGIGGWGAPLNIGEQVNGKGNETTPFFVDDYLVYATNGNADGYGGYDFYASKMQDEEIPQRGRQCGESHVPEAAAPADAPFVGRRRQSHDGERQEGIFGFRPRQCGDGRPAVCV